MRASWQHTAFLIAGSKARYERLFIVYLVHRLTVNFLRCVTRRSFVVVRANTHVVDEIVVCERVYRARFRVNYDNGTQS